MQQGFGIAFGVILARFLKPEDFGHFAFSAASVGLFLLPAGWSLAPQIVSEGHQNPHIVSDAIRFGWKITSARFLLLIVAALWLAKSSGLEAAGLGLLCGFPLILAEIVSIQRASLEANGQFKGNFWDSLLTVAISMSIAIPLALAGFGPWSLALPGIPLFVAQYFLFRRLSGVTCRPASVPSGRSYFQSGLLIWIANTADQAFSRIDKVFLGRFCPADVLGNYNRAFNYSPVGARIFNSLVTNPTVTALAREKSASRRRNLLTKSAIILGISGVINYVVWAFYSDPLVPWIFGPQWREAIPVFQAFAPFSLVISITYLPTTLLLARRQYGALAIIRLGVLILFIVYLALTSAHMSALSVAYGLQVAMTAVGLCYCGFLLIFQMKQSREKSTSQPT